jgi:hypothetical protein
MCKQISWLLFLGQSLIQSFAAVNGTVGEQGWMRSYAVQASHPCALAQIDDIRSIICMKRVVVFLDYDGTLTPIVSNPDHAFMSAAMRRTVQSIAEMFPTAIISGRARSKVEGFVQLPELFYAGSHGLDIKGPVVRVCQLCCFAGRTSLIGFMC